MSRISPDLLGPRLDYPGPGLPPQLVNRVPEEMGPALTRLDEHAFTLGPGFHQHQGRDSTTRTQVGEARGQRAHGLGHRQRVLHVGPDRAGAEQTQMPGSFEDGQDA